MSTPPCLSLSGNGRVVWMRTDQFCGPFCSFDGFPGVSLPVSADSPPWHLFGSARNAKLITRLAEQQQPMMLHNPVDALDDAQVKSPPAELSRLQWLCCSHDGLSRAYRFSMSDYVSYRLIEAVLSRNTTMAMELLLQHPAWSALSFVNIVDPASACALLAKITDPRWFVHPMKPHRASRLFKFLELSPSSFPVRSHEPGLATPVTDSSQLVLRCWFDPLRYVTTKDQSMPCDFLYRILHTSRSESPLLRACQQFVRFVTGIWLRERIIGDCDSSAALFDPDLFFAQFPAEAQAYRAHVAAMTRTRSPFACRG